MEHFIQAIFSVLLASAIIAMMNTIVIYIRLFRAEISGAVSTIEPLILIALTTFTYFYL